MDLSAHIEAVLLTHPYTPMSVAELVEAIPGSSANSVERACYALRAIRRLGRKGANSKDRPYRFYLKNDVRAELSL